MRGHARNVARRVATSDRPPVRPSPSRRDGGQSRRDRAWLAATLVAALAAGGCGFLPTATALVNRLPLGQALVLGRVVDERNRSIAEAAATHLAQSLRRSGDVLVAADVGGEMRPGDADARVEQLLEDLRRGRWPDPETCGRLEQLGLSTLVMVSVTEYDQIWGRYAKFTRVGLEAQAVHLPVCQTLWRFPGVAEVEDKRGRAFQLAMENAVSQIAAAVHPTAAPTSLASVWRGWRR